MSIASTAVFFTLSSMYMHGLGYHTTVAAAAVQDAVERDGWSDASFDRMPSFWNPGHEHGSVNDSSDDDQGKPDHSMYISILLCVTQCEYTNCQKNASLLLCM